MSQWTDDARVLLLPSGRRVRGRGLAADPEPDPVPEFGLYLLAEPVQGVPWEHTWVEWTDFGLPVDLAAARAALVSAWQRAATERVEIACMGGLGRTGTALACLAVLDGLPADTAVALVRSTYDSRAVETAEQVGFVTDFAEEPYGEDPGLDTPPPLRSSGTRPAGPASPLRSSGTRPADPASPLRSSGTRPAGPASPLRSSGTRPTSDNRAVRVGAYAVCVHDGEILLTHRAAPGPAQGKWTLPGGGVDFGEEPADAARRECREETGLVPDLGPLLDVHSSTYDTGDGIERHGIRILYSATFSDGRPEPVSPDDGEIDEVGWFPLDALPSPMTEWASLGARTAS